MHIGKRSEERVKEPDRPLLIEWCRDAGENAKRTYPIQEQPADPFLTRALLLRISRIRQITLPHSVAPMPSPSGIPHALRQRL